MAALKPYDARLRRQAVAPLLEEEIDFPSAEISLGALLRWCCLAIFPCYDVPDFRRQQKIRSDLSVGKPSYPIIRRWCQSRRHRCCWLCCAAVGPLIAVVLTALYIFYTAYLPAVSRQHPALYDTNGSKIDAHGGQMIMHDGVVYWYGESQKGLSARGYPVGVNQGWTNEGVNCYMSRDMLSWESAGMVFRNTSIVLPHNQPGPYVIERPKVVYNNLTRMFVMWMHVDSFSYGYTYAGVATSSSPLGPFVWKHAIRPNGYKSYDIQIWREPGTNDAYLIRDTDNHALTMLTRLTADYTDVEYTVSSAIAGPCEGMAMFKDIPGDGAHYMICSYATWYYPNAMQLHRKIACAWGGAPRAHAPHGTPQRDGDTVTAECTVTAPFPVAR